MNRESGEYNKKGCINSQAVTTSCLTNNLKMQFLLMSLSEHEIRVQRSFGLLWNGSIITNTSIATKTTRVCTTNAVYL